jgi:hypothetical protein
LTIGVYAKTSLHDIAGAVEVLPDLIAKMKPPAEPLALTGTDPAPINNRFAHYLPTEGDGPGRLESVSDAMADSDDPARILSST